MAQGPMRGAALAAVLAAVTCERARDCPRMLAVFTGPSRHGPEPAGMSGPAAERTAGRRLPAPSGPSAVPQPHPGPAADRYVKEECVMRVNWS